VSGCDFFALVCASRLSKIKRSTYLREVRAMKQFLTFGCTIALAFVMMDSSHVVKSPLGFSVVKGGSALAADLGPPPPPPIAAPVGKGKAPVLGKGKAPIVTRG
jgi:hypothetical protein